MIIDCRLLAAAFVLLCISIESSRRLGAVRSCIFCVHVYNIFKNAPLIIMTFLLPATETLQRDFQFRLSTLIRVYQELAVKHDRCPFPASPCWVVATIYNYQYQCTRYFRQSVRYTCNDKNIGQLNLYLCLKYKIK